MPLTRGEKTRPLKSELSTGFPQLCIRINPHLTVQVDSAVDNYTVVV